MYRVVWILALMLMALISCGRQEEVTYAPTFTTKPSNQTSQQYVVGVHPLHNPKRLMQIYGPILELANIGIPEAHFRLEPARSYEEFDKKLYAGYYDLAMPNPYQTISALKHGYHVFAKMGDDEEFRGIILVRKDGSIHEIADLRGKAVAYPAQTALAAAMMPQYYLYTHGINVNSDIDNRYVGSQESSILNVLHGHVAAAATWPVPWRSFSAEHPEMANQLEIKWQTTPLLNNGWVARNDVPQSIVDKFQEQLLGLDATAEGRHILARLPVSKFEAASDETYLPVVKFLENYSNNVREIKW